MRKKHFAFLSRPFLALSGVVILACALAVSPVLGDTTGENIIGYTPSSRSLFLDEEWYRVNLIKGADLWNGGLDGESGMGAYREDFDGFFRVILDRTWRPRTGMPSTSVAQSRAIYMNVEAYRAAGPAEGKRFLAAVEKGVACLLTRFRDPEYGGFFWTVAPDGRVIDPMKQGYGNVHPLFALAQAYGVTKDPRHLAAALEQLEVIKSRFLDPKFPGGISPGFSRDFGRIIGVNNVDVFTHLFEALLSLFDVTAGAKKEEVAGLIKTCGDFLVKTLYRDQAGYTDRGYVAYNYTEDWRPSQEPYSRRRQWDGAMHSSPGHGVELAYLLSRAVERGFDPEWLITARKLMKFCLEYAFDPKTGGMLYEVLDYEGRPLPGNPDNAYFLWWPQMESARALLHFAVARGWETGAAFKKIESFIQNYLIDREYGGLYQQLKADTLTPDVLDKGNIWKTNYHYTMFFAEALRLCAAYPARVASLNAGYRNKEGP